MLSSIHHTIESDRHRGKQAGHVSPLRRLKSQFGRPGRAFLLVLPPRHQAGGEYLKLSQRRSAFQAHAGAAERQEAGRL